VKPWYLLALALLLGPVTVAQTAAGSGGAAAEDTVGNAQALKVYEEGKRLYDAKDYAGALEKFDQAATLEPGKARWQYNRGLALRKLNRYQEARDALLKSRALEPEYKRGEIDDKLREMGFSTSEDSSTSGPASAPGSDAASSSKTTAGDVIIIGVGIILVLAFNGFILFLVVRTILAVIRRAKAGRSSDEESPRTRRTSKPPMRSVDVSPLDQRLDRVASALIPVEHALRLQEDADLRAMLNQATMAEQRARDEMEKARVGKVNPQAAESLVRAAEEGSTAATERARTLFGDRAFLPEGERVGCYFCARPLANASFRMQVPLKRGSAVTPVLACPPCANMASAGQPPPVKVRMEAGGRMVHWSELGGYDPYTHRHKPYLGIRMVPAWDFTPQRPLGEVAAMAAGGAVAAGLAAYGVSRLLDLDGAREAAAAQAAAQAAARQAGQRREERDWKDHS
jgi:hypothetical protein